MQLDVVGLGRVGTALVTGVQAAGGDCVAVGRDGGWERLAGRAGVPLVVATRNDDLPAVLAMVPADRRGDVVLVQNGMLRSYLAEAGWDDVTRGILFFAVDKRGAEPIPGGTSPFWGPRAAAVAEVFRGIGLPAAEVDAQAFAAVELEKVLWNTLFGLLGEALAVGVGVVAERPELAELVAELSPLGEAALGVTVDRAAMTERMRAYARTIPEYKATVKEWRWRSGWFVDAAARAGISLPLHEAWWAVVERRRAVAP